MTHTQYGTMVGTEDTGGITDAKSAVLLQEYATLAISTLSAGESIPCIAAELVGRFNKEDNTLGVVYLMSVVDAGQLAGALFNAAARIETEEAKKDFSLGFQLGSGGDRL